MTYKLFLDDIRFPPNVAYINEPNEWIIARNMEDAIWYIENHGLPYYISFDHDLAPDHYAVFDLEVKPRFDNTGYSFAKWFGQFVIDNKLELPENFDYYVHSMNPAGADNIKHYMHNFISFYHANRNH